VGIKICYFPTGSFSLVHCSADKNCEKNVYGSYTNSTRVLGQQRSRRSAAKLLHTHTHVHKDVYVQSRALLNPASPTGGGIITFLVSSPFCCCVDWRRQEKPRSMLLHENRLESGSPHALSRYCNNSHVDDHNAQLHDILTRPLSHTPEWRVLAAWIQHIDRQSALARRDRQMGNVITIPQLPLQMSLDGFT